MAGTVYAWKDYGAGGATTQPKKQPWEVTAPATSDTSTTATAQAGQAAQGAPAPTAGAGQFATSIKPIADVKPSGNSFKDMLASPQGNQLMGTVGQTVTDLLTPQQGGSQVSQLARQQWGKQAEESARQANEASALAGRAGTGQNVADKLRVNDSLLMQRGDLEQKLVAQDEATQLERQKTGLGAFQQLGQLAQGEKQIESAERLGYAGLNIQEKQLAQQAQQFADKQSFDAWALKQGLDDNAAQRIWQATQNERSIASTEKLGFAGLNIQEKQLAQQAYQFDSKQDFDKWAVTQNMDNATAERVWKSMESEKDRALTAGEGALSRELTKYGIDQSTGIEKEKLAAQIQQFDSELDFKKWATQAGLDDTAAGRVWQANQNDINRKHETGMQLTANEHEVWMQTAQADINKKAQELQGIIDKSNIVAKGDVDKILQSAQIEADNIRQDKSLTSSEYIAKLQLKTQEEMQKLGFSHDEAMQIAQINADKEAKRLDRENTDKWQAAEMLYKNEALQSTLGIQREELELKKQDSIRQATQWADQFGLNKLQVQQAMASEKADQIFGTIAAMQAMPGFENSPDMQAKANEMMTSVLVDQGVITKEEARVGKLNAELGMATSADTFHAWATSKGYTPAEIKMAMNSNPDFYSRAIESSETVGDVVKNMLMTGKASSNEDALKKLGIGDDIATASDPKSAVASRMSKNIDSTNFGGNVDIRAAALGGKTGTTSKGTTFTVGEDKNGDPTIKIGDATIDKWTPDQWKAISNSPAKIKELVDSGIAKDLSTAGSPARPEDVKKWLADQGVSNGAYEASGDGIKFTKPVVVVKDGKPYTLTRVASSTYGKGVFNADDWRVTRIFATDPTTGKEVKLTEKNTDI